MARLTYSEDDNDGQFHDTASGAFVQPGDTIEVLDDQVDEYLEHDVATFEPNTDDEEAPDVDVDVDATDTDEGDDDAEAGEAPFDPDDYAVGDLREELEDRDLSDDELDALEDAERADGDARSTALEAIDDQRGG